MTKDINLLFISEDHEAISNIIKSIKINNKHIDIASNEKEAIEYFDSSTPNIIFFYHSMVEHSQSLYMNMHQHCKMISQTSHRAILFCDHSDFEIAYNKCIQDTFFDYIIMPPRLDKLRINLTIKRALESINQQENISKTRDLSRISQNITECGDEIESSLRDVSSVSIACNESFNELSNTIKNKIKEDAPLLQTTTSNNIDEILSDTVDQPIESSRSKVDSIVDKYTSNISNSQKKFSSSLSELNDISNSLTTRVLMIDDDEIYGDMVSLMLEQTKNYEVKHVVSVQQGLVSFVCDRPDIILLDFELTDGDANLFLEEMHKLPRNKDIPIIMLTSHTTTDVYSTTSMLGATGFIRKPASKEIIISNIKKGLEQS